jgi:hypothetical protein
MPIINEWWDFHLTPAGWVQGSYQIDPGGEQKLDVPSNVILTRRFTEKTLEPLAPKKRTYVDISVKDEALAGELLHLYPFPRKYYSSFQYASEN